MSAFDRVLEKPASLAARYELLAEWQAARHPQAGLLERQLAYRRYQGANRRSDDARRLAAEIDRLIEERGRAWAGPIAERVTEYRYFRGLVAEVVLPGGRFLEVLPGLLPLAPIQHVILTAPWGSLEEIAASPLLARLTSLCIDGAGAACGDRGAQALAGSPHVAGLVELTLEDDDIHELGATALVASPGLARARRVSLGRNPCDPTPRVLDAGQGLYEAFRPPLAGELEERHGPRPWLALPTGDLAGWPPHRDELALLDDYVSDEQLARLEELALLVDRLAAGTEDEQVTAGAKRQRLLIELDVYGLLKGTPDVGRRVAGWPTLRAYHDACVEMARYHASAARQRLVRRPPPLEPAAGHVSLDWFRTPSGYLPDGVSPDDWLALCEINFLEPMPTGAGERYVRLEGELHELDYRIEATGEPKLWRALLPGWVPRPPRDAATARRRSRRRDVDSAASPEDR